MTTGETWRGPFDSRAEFEKTQDNSIAKLARFACKPPELSREPVELKSQLWEMGKYLPTATLGLGRHNTDNTELIVWEAPPHYTQLVPGYAVSNRRGPTQLTGIEAYERMVGSWHNINGLTDNHRFEVQTSGPNDQLNLVYLAPDAQSIITGRSLVNNAFEQIGSFVFMPDTSHTDAKDDIDWADSPAHDGAPAFKPEYTPPPHYYANPFTEKEKNPADLSEAGIESLAGTHAVDAFRNHGEVGLYQHLLWSKVNTLLLRLDLGPAKSL